MKSSPPNPMSSFLLIELILMTLSQKKMKSSPPNPMSSFLLIELILMTLVLFRLTQAGQVIWVNKDEDLMDKTCRQTPYYDLCLTSLESNPQSSKVHDVKGLAIVMVDNVVANASDTLSFIEGLIKQTQEKQLEQALAFCAELYIPLVKFSLPQAADAITQGRYGFANYGISDAVKEIDSCQKKFSSSKSSPISDRNDIFLKLCDVAVAILNLLLKG